MAWLIQFAQSSIGKKLIMSLTGLFLCLFLVIHLIGNLQLLKADGGEAFNTYASFMSNNGLIKFVSIGTYFFILWHAVQGIIIALSNSKKRNGKYAVKSGKSNSFASRNMIWLGLMILIFLGIHMGDFWYKMKFTDHLGMKTYPGYDHAVKDLYTQVYTSFHESWIVIV